MDAIVTDDTRIVKNRSVVHYIPILYTPDFIHVLYTKNETKNRDKKHPLTKKDLEKEAFLHSEHVMQ